MLILAIDSTGLAASAALVIEEKILAEYTTNYKKTHSQTLLPIIAECFRVTGLNVSDVDYIACASGPGSFTGIRIGAATAKGLAFAHNKPIVPVAALDALAYNIGRTENIILPVMDARREQVYAACYLCGGQHIKRLSDYVCEDALFTAKEALKKAEELCGNNEIYGVTVLGDGSEVVKRAIE